jgi:outer membrane protein TolC
MLSIRINWSDFMFPKFKLMHPWFLLWALYSLLFNMPAFAESDEHDHDLQISAQLSLHDLVEKTIVRYPDSALLVAKKIEIEAKYKRANGLLPAAPAIGLLNRNDAVTSNRGEREWESELELPLWLPGQRAAREALARDAALGFIDTKATLNLQVAGMVRNALWDIAMVTHQATLAKSRHVTSLALLTDIEKRVKAGDLPKTDRMLAQNEAYQAETILLRALAEIKHAQYRYKLLTGLNTLPEFFSELQSKTTFDDSHPALREASKKILVADDERNLIKVERRSNPTVSLSARTQRGAFDNQINETIGLKLKIPFETEAQSAPLMAIAEVNYAKNQADAQHLRYALEAAFHEAEHNLEVTKAELAITTKQHANAQESLRLAKKAFALGETDLVSLLRSQATAYEAERAMTQRQIQVQWDTAHYNQAAGEMP